MFLDSMMAHPGGGFVPAVPSLPNSELHQNPHMHLFEALLALYAITKKDEYRVRLGEILFNC